MRARRLTLLAACALSACGREPSGAACPHDPGRYEDAPMTVVLDPAPATVRRDLSVADLAKYPGTEALGPGGKLQGLTVARQELRYRTGIAVRPRLFGGPSCAWIDALTVDITPREVVILVPREYAPGTCQDEQILAHERSHEETIRDELAQAAADMRLALRRADWLPGRATPLAVADRAEAERRIEAMIDKAVKPVYDAHMARLKERQAVIDLPENYRWTSSRCASWR
ncbi:MAG: hypothetical protein HY079_03610 [Elusimicrobia bacterium]|nr:hypothetical protein [Elusimicrobiota bacterium]